MEKLETAMKSLCAHQDQLKIYVLNEDLPTEWFAIMNQRLRQLDSEVINSVGCLLTILKSFPASK